MTEANISQPFAALQIANRVRLHRAAFKNRVSAADRIEGRHILADGLEDPPDYLASVRLIDAVIWPRRMYRKEARDILAVAGITNLTKTIGETTPRQRHVVQLGLRAGVTVDEAAFLTDPRFDAILYLQSKLQDAA